MVVLLDPSDDPDDILRANRSREKQFVFDCTFDGTATQVTYFNWLLQFNVLCSDVSCVTVAFHSLLSALTSAWTNYVESYFDWPLSSMFSTAALNCQAWWLWHQMWPLIFISYIVYYCYIVVCGCSFYISIYFSISARCLWIHYQISDRECHQWLQCNSVCLWCNRWVTVLYTCFTLHCWLFPGCCVSAVKQCDQGLVLLCTLFCPLILHWMNIISSI